MQKILSKIKEFLDYVSPVEFRIHFYVLTAISFFFISTMISWDMGYESGANDGVTTALDTVNSILDRQLISKDTVTKVILISPDTNEYILSTKTILKK